MSIKLKTREPRKFFSSSMAAYLDANLLNRILQGYLAVAPGALEWKLSASLFDFDVKLPCPLVSFGPQGDNAPAGANIGLSLDGITVNVGVNGTPPADALCFAFDCNIYAAVATANGRIELGDLAVKLAPHVQPGLTEALARAGAKDADFVVSEAAKLLIPRIQEWAAKLPFPQIHNLFGTNLDATLVDVDVREVQGDYMLCAAVELGQYAAGSTGAALLPPPPFERSSSGTLMLLVSAQAINLVIDTLLVGHEYRLRRKHREGGVRLGIKSRVRTESARFEISGDYARASARVGFKKTRAGVKFSRSWDWMRVKIRNVRACVDIALVATEERKANLVFKGIRKLDVKVKRRGWGISTDVINDVLDDAIDDFLPVVNRWFRGKRFELFQLPETIPGTQIPMPIVFNADGLRFHSGLILAEFTVANGSP